MGQIAAQEYPTRIRLYHPADAARCTDGRTVLVAEGEGGRLLGFGDMEADEHPAFLYAAPEAEGRGVGSALLAALEEVARAQAAPASSSKQANSPAPCSDAAATPSSAATTSK